MSKSYYIKPLYSCNEASFQALIDICRGYEPFYDFTDGKIQLGIIQCGAFDTQDNLIGFASVICIDSKINQWELTGLVHPDYRRMGIFTLMIKNLKERCNKEVTFYGAIDTDCQFLTHCSMMPNYAYSELLMSLNETEYNNNAGTNIHTTDEYECLFSDDFANYLMYYKDEEEPCAVCDLSISDNMCCISCVFVDEDRRGQGLGTYFMTHLIEDFFNTFKISLTLQVSSKNKAAVKLYNKCGFTTASKIKYYKF